MAEKNTNILRPDRVVCIPTTLDSFFENWVVFLKPLHGLTPREMSLCATFLKKRYELSKDIKNPVVLDKYLMNEDTKREIRTECEMTLPHFQVAMGKLKKSGVIVDGKLNPKFIPNIQEDQQSYNLSFLFQLKK